MNQHLSRQLQRCLNQWQLFGAGLGWNVTIDDSVHGIWHGASGSMTIESAQPMPVGCKFYIYSITKTFTAVRVMQLAEQGYFALDDAVTLHLPGLPLPSSVTIRRLLNHTAGIPNYTSLPAYPVATRDSPSQPWSYEHTLTLTCNGTLDFSPGEKWSYSNTGYMLLVALIERTTSESFSNNIKEGITDPLALHHTYLAEHVDQGSVVPGYCRDLNDAEIMENITPRYHPWWCKTGLIVSTTEETARFYRHLFAGALVGSDALMQMKQWISIGTGAGPFFGKPGYGLGLMIDPESRFGKFFGHGGGGPGFTTWAMHLSEFEARQLTMAVFGNTSLPDPPFYLIKDFLKILRGG